MILAWQTPEDCDAASGSVCEVLQQKIKDGCWLVTSARHGPYHRSPDPDPTVLLSIGASISHTKSV